MAIELENARVALTGAAGLIGRSLTRQLLEAGAHVVAIDQADLRVDAAGMPGDVAPVRLDVRDRDALREVLADCDAAVHFASILTFASDRSPRDGFDINLVSTFDVLDAMAARAGSRVVLASSIGTYGSPPHPEHVLGEDDPLLGRSLYAVSKIAAELYAEAFARSRDLSYLALRFGTVYGPGQHGYHVIPRFLLSVLDDIDAGRTPVVEFEPQGEHDLVFTADAATAVVRALTGDRDGLAVNVVTGRSVTLEAVFHELLDIYGADAAISWQPGSSPLPTRRRFSAARAAEVLGYVPDTPLRDGLEALVAWRRAHPTT